MLLNLRIALGATLALLILTQNPKAGESIVLGAALSLTGKYATDGEHTKNGYDLAVKVINDAGGVTIGDQTHKIAIKYYDDESTPERSAELVERLIVQDGIGFILGPFSTELTRAVVPIIEQYKVPMVEGNGASRARFAKDSQYLFSVLTNTDRYLSGAIEMAAQRARRAGRKVSELKVAVAIQGDPFNRQIRAGLLDDVKARAMQVVIDDTYPVDFNDMATTLDKVKALKPDILVVSGRANGAAAAIRQIAEMRVDVPMLVLTACEDAQILKKFTDRADYTVCASQWTPAVNYRDDLFGSAADYAKLFDKTYNYSPPYQAAGSSAAVMAFVEAFTHAGSLEVQKVRDALAQVDIRTFFGIMKFDRNGNNIAKPTVLYQVLDGRYKVISPAKCAQATLVYPRPDWSRR